MEGKVTFYNPSLGKGKILTKDEKVFNFVVDAWKDFDTMPSVGLLVDFEIDGANRIIKITTKKGTKPQNEPKINQKTKEEIEIKETKPLRECLDEYYGDIFSVLKEYEDLGENEKELNFLKLKRFLFTAYNDLYELDSALTDNEMDKVKNELLRLQKEYETFKIKSSYPLEYLFEKIYLSKQTNYLKLQDELDLTISKIKNFSIKEKPLLEKIKQKELELLEIEDKKSDEYKKVEEQLKALKKRYVDLLHELALMREKRDKLTKILSDFKQKHLDEFEKEEKSLSRYLDAKLLRILNVKAYKFDTTMWEKAKKSRLIRQFFMDAGIEGTYSSRTFLKYYLKTLDKDKLTPENKELFELQKYLDSLGNESILVIRNSVEKAVKTKYLIEGIDKELKVTAIYDPMESFKICLKDKPDLIIFDFNMRTINALEYLKKFKEACPSQEKEITFCVIIGEENKEYIKELKKEGVKYFFNSAWGDYEFVDYLRSIL